MNWKYPEWKKNAIGKTKKNISKILFMVNGSNMWNLGSKRSRGGEIKWGMENLKEYLPEILKKTFKWQQSSIQEIMWALLG